MELNGGEEFLLLCRDESISEMLDMCLTTAGVCIFFQVKFAKIKLTRVHNTLALLHLFNFV